MLRLDRAAGHLWDEAGRLFEPGRRAWHGAAGGPRGETVGIEDAVRWLQTASGSPCRVPVGVIGPRAAEPRQLETAARLGGRLAGLGLVVLCGGREGVMAAVCEGVAAAGGTSIGLLPDDSWEAANPHVTVPIATGLGVARNAVIARASLCLVAVGGGYGTLAEVAFGLQFGRPVFGLDGAPEVAGVVALGSVDDACRAVARVALGLDP
jgi:uncharacterized protein (TIGR00725 family)